MDYEFLDYLGKFFPHEMMHFLILYGKFLLYKWRKKEDETNDKKSV